VPRKSKAGGAELGILLLDRCTMGVSMVDRDVAASATAVRIARTPSQGADRDLEPY